jgi:hypothetical protein
MPGINKTYTFNVPSTKYKYRLPLAPTPGVAPTEFLVIGINTTANPGTLSLHLEARSPGDPQGGGAASCLTNHEIVLSAPRCPMSGASAVPPGGSGPWISGSGTNVVWRRPSVGNTDNADYSVNFNWAAGKQRFDVVLRADEFDRPVRVLVREVL